MDGHPDPDRTRYVHALADAYAQGAEAAGHKVARLGIAELGLKPLVSAREWDTQSPLPEQIGAAQRAIAGAEHIVLLYPLWLGDIPAALKAFLEQVLRPGFAFPEQARGSNSGLLKGRSARLIVTMGMPARFYRWRYAAHSLRSLERNVLHFVGIRPVRSTVIGNVEGMGLEKRRAWLDHMRLMGATAS